MIRTFSKDSFASEPFVDDDFACGNDVNNSDLL